MFDGLRDEIMSIDTDADLDDVAALFALQDQIQSRLATMVATIDATGACETSGATSTAAWLRHIARRSGAEASRIVKAARKLRHFPTVQAAWDDGRLATAQVETIVANVKNRHVELFAWCIPDLLPFLLDLDVQQTQQVMRAWASLADDAIPGPDEDDPESTVFLSRGADDRGVLKGSISPEAASMMEAALALFDSGDREVHPAQRRAEALDAICQFALDHHEKATGRRNRPHLTVVMREGPDGEPVAGTLNGRPVSRGRLQQWMCDGLFDRIMTAENRIIDYGRNVQAVPDALWRVVAVRDQGCRFPGCDRPVSWCDAHHVQPFTADGGGGETNPENLALFCKRHHTCMHDKSGWTVTMEPCGTLTVVAPDGTVQVTYPPGLDRPLWPPGNDPPDEPDT